MNTYTLYHSESELAYTLLEAGRNHEVLEDDAKAVETFHAPNWKAARKIGDNFIKGDNHEQEEDTNN